MTPVSNDPGVRIVASTGLLPSISATNPRGYTLSWGAVDVNFTAMNVANRHDRMKLIENDTWEAFNDLSSEEILTTLDIPLAVRASSS